MLALGLSLSPLSPLLLDLDPEGFGLGADDDGPALKDSLVDVRGTLHGVIPAAEDARAVQAQHVTGDDAGHAEGQTDLVAFADKVGETVDVDGDVVVRLRGEKR